MNMKMLHKKTILTVLLLSASNGLFGMFGFGGDVSFTGAMKTSLRNGWNSIYNYATRARNNVASEVKDGPGLFLQSMNPNFDSKKDEKPCEREELARSNAPSELSLVPVPNVAKKAGEKTIAVIKTVANKIHDLDNNAAEAFSNGCKAVVRRTSDAVNTVRGSVSDTMSLAGAVVSYGSEETSNAVARRANTAKKGAQLYVDSLNPNFKVPSNRNRPNLPPSFAPNNEMTVFPEVVHKKVDAATDMATKSAKETWHKVKNKAHEVKEMYNAGKKTFNNTVRTINNVSDVVSTASKDVKEHYPEIKEGIKNNLETLKGAVQACTDNVLPRVSEAVSRTADTITHGTKEVKRGIRFVREKMDEANREHEEGSTSENEFEYVSDFDVTSGSRRNKEKVDSTTGASSTKSSINTQTSKAASNNNSKKDFASKVEDVKNYASNATVSLWNYELVGLPVTKIGLGVLCAAPLAWQIYKSYAAATHEKKLLVELKKFERIVEQGTNAEIVAMYDEVADTVLKDFDYLANKISTMVPKVQKLTDDSRSALLSDVQDTIKELQHRIKKIEQKASIRSRVSRLINKLAFWR